MTVYFITRHPGATAWAAECGLRVDHRLTHLEAEVLAILRPGDVVAGILPVNLAAAVCARGARFLSLSLDLPPEARGRELDALEMCLYGARLEEYRVQSVPGRESGSKTFEDSANKKAGQNDGVVKPKPSTRGGEP